MDVLINNVQSFQKVKEDPNWETMDVEKGPLWQWNWIASTHASGTNSSVAAILKTMGSQIFWNCSPHSGDSIAS